MDMILEHWLSAGAGVFLIGMVLYGHYRGALKQCVSLGALILTIVLVKIATPYMTDFIKEPFTLVLIDHHTDMQDASLGGDILSCGNWAKKVLQENPYLQRLVLIGQEKKALDKLQSGARQQETDGKLVEISYEELKNGKAHEKIKKLPDEVPVYISIDKDVLDEKYAVTNWDQGKMSMGMLEQILKTLVTEYDVIGVDICGMYPEENSLPEYLRAERVNIRSDEELYRFLQMSLLKKKELLSL